MITYLQAVLLGFLQGVTELFPISSLGHSILLTALFYPSISEGSEYFVLFLVATHFATAVALLIFFWEDWVRIIQGFFRLVFKRTMGPQDTYARLALLLIIATIPAGLIGLVFQKRLQLLFGSPKIVAVVLIFNGLLLYSIELFKQQRMRRENLRIVGDVAIVKMTWLAALGTGLMQSLALIPGFSRTGSSLAGGLLAGLDRESAARFSFLLATPIIFAAAALKLPELLKVHDYPVAQIGVGALAAGIGAFISASFLTRYFKTNTLRPFAIYCIVAGLILVYLLTR